MSKQIEEIFCDAVQLMVDNAVSKAGYDATIKATILSCFNALTGEYKIKYQDNTLTAYSLNADTTYKKGALVYVQVPNNDLKNRKSIIGAVKSDDENYSISVEQDATYDFIGTNVVSNGATTLNSYHTESKELYNYSNDAEDNVLTLDIFAVDEYIKENGSIYCAADFQTSLPQEQQLQGNYGIIFALDFNSNNNEEDVITKYYSINVNNMTGNPYKLLQPTRQYAFFDINNANFIRVNSITAFVQNFPNQDQFNTVDDIFITNISLQAANKMTSDELAGYSINLTTPEGSIFTTEASPDAELPIAATVKLRGQEIDDTNIEFYWFVEDATIKTNSSYYSLYGGLGWKCLNELSSTGTFVAGKNEFSIKFSDAAARNNTFKCVAVYNGNIFNKTINIKNYLAVNITIVSDSGTNFYYDQGNPILSCLIDGVAHPEYSYIWLKTDDNGVEEIDNTTYQYQVNIGQLTNYAIFKCAAVSNGFSLGTASITLTNSLESESGYSLTIVNGTQVFKYDENGVSPTSQSNDVPMVLEPLRLQLTSADGAAIADSVLENLPISWEIPTEDTLLIVEEDSLSRIELSYDIAASYNYKKTNNTISVSVVYQGQTLSAQTNFLFLKDGDPGTNGTNYVCKIVPNVADGQTMPDRVIYDVSHGRLNYNPAGTNTQWVRAQLWENGELVFDGVSSQNDFTVAWSILQNKYDYNTSDLTDLTINSNTGQITCSGYNEKYDVADIVKVVITTGGVDYTAVLPITLVNLKNLSYNISIPDGSGFKFVTYSSDGRLPQYDNSNPFQVNLINGGADISENSNVSYTWNIKGAIYQEYQWVDQNLLSENTSNDEQLSKNQKNFKPASAYDGQCVSVAIECVIRVSGSEAAKIHIPVYLGLNKYGLAALNGWDGNSIQVDSTGGFILAPQMGAGRKESDNSFTGMFLGEVKESSYASKEVGIFGYNHGQRSIFLNAETGSAAFGIANQGQIIIDPTDGRATIRSGNYINGSSGMEIDLTAPSIKYGNGNFYVDENGELNASVGTLGASNAAKIHISGNTANSFIYSGNKTSLTASSSGFYLGTDGFSMGQGGSGQGLTIKPSGEMTATSITVQRTNTSNSRIEISAGSTNSEIDFYYGGTRRGYIRGGAQGLEIYGQPTYVGGSSMDISASSLDISSSTMEITSNVLYLRPGTLYARTNSGSGYAPAVSATYQILSLKTHANPGVPGFPTLTKVYYNMTFYNGILVDTSSGEETDE